MDFSKILTRLYIIFDVNVLKDTYYDHKGNDDRLLPSLYFKQAFS